MCRFFYRKLCLLYNTLQKNINLNYNYTYICSRIHIFYFYIVILINLVEIRHFLRCTYPRFLFQVDEIIIKIIISILLHVVPNFILQLACTTNSKKWKENEIGGSFSFLLCTTFSRDIIK
jgi:hypothetical protein